MPTVTDDPSQSLDWATSGTNVATPPSGDRVTGFVPGQRPPAQWVNYLFDAAKRWVASFVSNDDGCRFGTLFASQLEHRPAATADLDTWVISVAGIKQLRIGSKVITDVSGGAVYTDTDVADRSNSGGDPCLVFNARYHVYVGVSGSSLVWNVSRTAPTADGKWKTGFVGTWAYVTSFCADGGGWPRPFQTVGSRTSFVSGGYTSTDNTIASRTAGSASAAIDLTPWVPAGRARLAHLRVTRPTGSNATEVRFYAPSSTAQANETVVQFSAASGYCESCVTVRVSEAGNSPFVENMSGGNDITIVIEGFESI